MFTKFRRLLSLIIIGFMAVGTYVGLKRAGAVEGAGLVILKQALYLFGGIFAILFLAARFRPKPEE